MRVAGIDDGAEVACGNSHTCARARTGAIRCWGGDNVGQLGNGTDGASATPVAVVGIDDAISITIGQDHSCALRASGELWCWGRNQYGRLGDGTTTDRDAPVRIDVR